jgi:hypothetical protein
MVGVILQKEQDQCDYSKILVYSIFHAWIKQNFH